MAAVTVTSDSGDQEEEFCHYFHLFPFYLPCNNGARCYGLSFFLIFSLKLTLSLSTFTLTKRLFIVPLHFLPLEWSSSLARSYPTLCDHMDCNTPGFRVHHQLLELAKTHVHRVRDAIQPSHPLLSPSPAFNLSQHQGLFQWVSSLHQVVKVLELQLRSGIIRISEVVDVSPSYLDSSL